MARLLVRPLNAHMPLRTCLPAAHITTHTRHPGPILAPFRPLGQPQRCCRAAQRARRGTSRPAASRTGWRRPRRPPAPPIRARGGRRRHAAGDRHVLDTAPAPQRLERLGQYARRARRRRRDEQRGDAAAVRRVALGCAEKSRTPPRARRSRLWRGSQVGDSALRVAERALVRLALSGMGVAEAGVRVRRCRADARSAALRSIAPARRRHRRRRRRRRQGPGRRRGGRRGLRAGRWKSSSRRKRHKEDVVLLLQRADSASR